jgi:murein DD-endopeptidase
MTTLTRLLPLCVFLLCETPVLAGDPHAPQLDVSFLAQPAPLVQNGSTRLFYEMLITNFSKSPYVVDSIEAQAGNMHSRFSGETLAAMTTHLGDPAKPGSSTDRTIEAGRSVLVFLLLDLGESKAPASLENLLHVIDDKGEVHHVILTPLSVSSESPIVIEAPLRGEPSFLAGNGIPYEFLRGEASGPVEANVSAPTAISFGAIGQQRPFAKDYPAANALLTFK